MTEQDTRACCAHLVIHYRTEPAEHGTVRGYWACATCQKRTSDPFARIPEKDEPASPSRGGGEPEDLYDQIGFPRVEEATGLYRAMRDAQPEHPSAADNMVVHRLLCDFIAAMCERGKKRRDALKSQPPTDGLRERVEALLAEQEGLNRREPEGSIRSRRCEVIVALRAALAATQPEALEPKERRTFWALSEDVERLTARSPEEAAEDVEEAGPVKVYGFRQAELPESSVRCYVQRALEYLYEALDLDEDCGDPDGSLDNKPPKSAEDALVRAVMDDYDVWTCQRAPELDTTVTVEPAAPEVKP